MANQSVIKRYTLGEEIGSAITHGIGTVLSIAGLVLLIVKAVRYAPIEYKVSYIVGFIIFGVSLNYSLYRINIVSCINKCNGKKGFWDI